MNSASLAKVLATFAAAAWPCLVLAGPRLYVSDMLADTVLVIDTATNTLVGDPIGASIPQPLAPVVSADGSRVYVQSATGPIEVIDAATLTATRTLADPNPDATGGAGALAVSVDGSKLFASGSTEGSIAVVDAAQGTVLTHLVPDGAPIHIAALRTSHDGTRLYALDGVGLSITAIDLGTQHTAGRVNIEPAGTADELLGMAVSSDDRSLYAVTYYGQLVRINADSMTISSSDPVGHAAPGTVGAQIYGIALPADGSRAFVAESGTACLLEVDLGASSSISATSIADNNACFSVAAGRDGKHAYVAAYDIESDAYSVVALDRADNAAAIAFGVEYPNFDEQSLDSSGATLTPRTGLWWTPGLPGSSFEIEVQNGTLVVVATAYADGGAPSWRMASGSFDAAAGTFLGEFMRYDGGSCLGCAYRAPTGSAPDGGNVTIAFDTAISGTLSVGGTTLPIVKYAW